MRFLAGTLAPLTLLLLTSSGSVVAQTPDVQTRSRTAAPTCLDLTQVQGPVIEFGQEGGNIRPFSVKIDADGQVTTDGPIHLNAERLSPLTVKALVRLAGAEHFWRLPEFTGQGVLPDIASQFVTINLSCASRHVAVRGGAQTGAFAELYTLLSDLVRVQRF